MPVHCACESVETLVFQTLSQTDKTTEWRIHQFLRRNVTMLQGSNRTVVRRQSITEHMIFSGFEVKYLKTVEHDFNDGHALRNYRKWRWKIFCSFGENKIKFKFTMTANHLEMWLLKIVLLLCQPLYNIVSFNHHFTVILFRHRGMMIIIKVNEFGRHEADQVSSGCRFLWNVETMRLSMCRLGAVYIWYIVRRATPL